MKTRCKELREHAGFSVRLMSNMVKIAPAGISQIENGQRVAWPKARHAFSIVLGESEDHLFDARGFALPTVDGGK